MPKAEISIDVAGREDRVDALDWKVIYDELLQTLRSLTKTIAAAKDIRRRSRARWAITEARTQSPLHLTLTEQSQDLDDPSEEVVRLCIEGIRALDAEATPPEAPPFFEEKTLASIRRLVSVLKKNTTSLVFSSPGVDPASASLRVANNIDELIGAKFKATGALEGILETLSAKGQITFKLHDPITDWRITCRVSSDKMEQAKAAWPHRVAVYGDIRYAKSGKPLSIEVRQIRRLRGRTDLPQLKDIEGIDITERTNPTEHLRRLRDGE